VTRRESFDRRELVRITCYVACVLVSLLGGFVFGKAWFTVLTALCLGIPFVNWLTRE
jgi:hypothetical protein